MQIFGGGASTRSAIPVAAAAVGIVILAGGAPIEECDQVLVEPASVALEVNSVSDGTPAPAGVTRQRRVVSESAHATAATELDIATQEVDADAARAWMAAAEGNYILREGAEALLREHAWLGPLLHEVATALRYHFGKNADIAVEPCVDEEDETLVMLFALVITNLSGDDAADRMYDFRKRWWVPNVDRTRGRLHVSVEFV